MEQPNRHATIGLTYRIDPFVPTDAMLLSASATLSGVCDAGDAPLYVGPDVFLGLPQLILYRMPGAAGWGARFAGCPVVEWTLGIAGLRLDTSANSFAFRLTGSTNMPVAIEATTNVITGPWVRLYATNLVKAVLDFADIDSSSYPARFYRIVGP